MTVNLQDLADALKAMASDASTASRILDDIGPADANPQQWAGTLERLEAPARLLWDLIDKLLVRVNRLPEAYELVAAEKTPGRLVTTAVLGLERASALAELVPDRIGQAAQAVRALQVRDGAEVPS